MNYQKIQPECDRVTVKYDIKEHNWPEYWLKIAKQKFPKITTLEKVHEILSSNEIVQLGRHCQEACGTDEFADRVDKYFTHVVDKNIGYKEWLIQRYFTIRIVVPNQASEGRLLAFHQGIWVGNGLGLRTIWTPFTEVYDSNSMWVAPFEESVKITKNIYKNKWDYDTIQKNCLESSKPIKLSPGQTYIFQQQHIHGNINNTSNITRWSMDGRILPKGGHYHRKMPGGYFRFVGEKESNNINTSDKKWISYAGWNSNFSNYLPLPMQRSVIDQYCNKFNIKINDYQFENEYTDRFPGLEKYITGYNIDGIVICSIYCLPDNQERRVELLNLAVENNIELRFANELTSVKSKKDIEHIENIFEYVNENTDPNIEAKIKI